MGQGRNCSRKCREILLFLFFFGIPLMRNRKGATANQLENQHDIKSIAQERKEEYQRSLRKKNKDDLNLGATFWMTRVVLLKALAFVYFVAFYSAFSQNQTLIGEDGILPISQFLSRLHEHYGYNAEWEHPTVFFFYFLS